jgi:hypothetical protein
LADFSDWQTYRLLHLAMPGPQRAEQPEAFHGAPFPPYRQKNRTLPSFGLRVSLFSDSPMQIRRQTANRSQACRPKGEGEEQGSPCVAGRSRPTCGKRDKEQGTAWPPGREMPVSALPSWAVSKLAEGIHRVFRCNRDEPPGSGTGDAGCRRNSRQPENHSQGIV